MASCPGKLTAWGREWARLTHNHSTMVIRERWTGTEDQAQGVVAKRFRNLSQVPKELREAITLIPIHVAQRGGGNAPQLLSREAGLGSIQQGSQGHWDVLPPVCEWVPTTSTSGAVEEVSQAEDRCYWGLTREGCRRSCGCTRWHLPAQMTWLLHFSDLGSRYCH